jgi:hypothetical protein
MLNLNPEKLRKKLVQTFLLPRVQSTAVGRFLVSYVQTFRKLLEAGSGSYLYKKYTHPSRVWTWAIAI